MRPLARIVALGLWLAAGQSAAQAQAQPRDSVTPVQLPSPVLRLIRLAFPDSVRQRMRDSLAAGRARWAARGPRRYWLETRMGCFCFATYQPEMPRWPAVEVHDGAIVGVRQAAELSDTYTGIGWAATVDDLFASAEQELRDSTRVVSLLELDARYGFPRRVHADTPGVTDVWSHIEVRRFTPVRD